MRATDKCEHARPISTPPPPRPSTPPPPPPPPPRRGLVQSSSTLTQSSRKRATHSPSPRFFFFFLCANFVFGLKHFVFVQKREPPKLDAFLYTCTYMGMCIYILHTGPCPRAWGDAPSAGTGVYQLSRKNGLGASAGCRGGRGKQGREWGGREGGREGVGFCWGRGGGWGGRRHWVC